MDCDTIERENIVERYLAGTLPPLVKEQWELHYFSCDRCAELLATWQAIEQPLRQQEGAIRREIRRRNATSRWLWAGAAIAAALLIGLAIELPLSRQHPSVPGPATATAKVNPWTELARLDPPAYQPSTLRSAGSKAEIQFQTAMDAYMRRDYPQTIAGLTAALELDPTAPAPRFFLGACYLLIGDTAAAARELERVASGDSPFAEEARFDLAKAYLLLGQKDRALAALRLLAGTPGDFRESARQLMERVNAVP